MRVKAGRVAAFLAIFLAAAAGLAQAADVTTHVLGAKQMTLSSATDTVNAGYYSSTTLSAVDSDFSAANIAIGQTIFGTTGTYTFGYGIPKTGQTDVYHVGGGNDLGDDGVTQKGYAGVRFTDNGDRTITDNATGLMWMKCALGQDDDDSCSGTAATFDWNDAFSQVASKNAASFAGHSDWRLPNAKELQSLADYIAYAPTIDASFFPSTQNFDHWTSTTYAADDSNALTVDFNDGRLDKSDKTSVSYVRCVRTAPPF